MNKIRNILFEQLFFINITSNLLDHKAKNLQYLNIIQTIVILGL